MIGRIIQTKRKEAGLTQAQLAERLGVTAPAVNRWEKDLSFPDATLLAPLARCLKTDLNELFSFYNELSDKERELIVDQATRMLASDDASAMDFIETSIKENLSDGLLCKELARKLYGFHIMKSASSPLIYLDKVAEYYERAMELLPEQTEEISHTLISVYGELGDADKAEEAWSRMSDTKPDKEWAHTELLCLLKDYDAAIPEIKTYTLRKIIELSNALNYLHEILTLSGNDDLAAIANEKGSEFRKLFEMWQGIDVINRISKAIVTSNPDEEIAEFENILKVNAKGERLSNCELFRDVSLGNSIKGKKTTADLLSDLLDVLGTLK